jgi:hypothetical protein
MSRPGSACRARRTPGRTQSTGWSCVPRSRLMAIQPASTSSQPLSAWWPMTVPSTLRAISSARHTPRPQHHQVVEDVDAGPHLGHAIQRSADKRRGRAAHADFGQGRPAARSRSARARSGCVPVRPWRAAPRAAAFVAGAGVGHHAAQFGAAFMQARPTCSSELRLSGGMPARWPSVSTSIITAKRCWWLAVCHHGLRGGQRVHHHGQCAAAFAQGLHGSQLVRVPCPRRTGCRANRRRRRPRLPSAWKP